MLQIKNFFKIQFVKEATILQTTSLMAVFLGALVSIVFARILGPEVYGIWGIILALSDIIRTPLNLGQGQTVLVELAEAIEKKDQKQAEELRFFYMKITMLLVVPIGLLLIIFMPQILALLKYSNEYTAYLRIMISLTLISQVFQYQIVLLQSHRKIKKMALLELARVFFESLLAILLIVLGLKIWGILLGQTLSFLISIPLALWLTKSLTKTIVKRDFHQKIKKTPLKKYLKLSLLIATDKNISRFFNSLPIYIMGLLFYSRFNRVLQSRIFVHEYAKHALLVFIQAHGHCLPKTKSPWKSAF